MKTVQLEHSCSMQTERDRQTDMTKLMDAFCNFANVLKKILCLCIT